MGDTEVHNIIKKEVIYVLELIKHKINFSSTF